MTTIKFNIAGNHETHSGEAIVVDNFNDGTIEVLNNLPGKMDDLKTRLIGVVDGYKIYENYYDPGSEDYMYFAVMQ